MLSRRSCRPEEEEVAARPLAGLAVKIVARTCWALALAPRRGSGRLRSCRRHPLRLTLTPLPIALPLPSSAGPAPFTGSPPSTGLPTPPASRRLPTRRTAIATLGTIGPEPLFTVLEQALPPPAAPTRPLRRKTDGRILVTDHGRLHSRRFSPGAERELRAGTLHGVFTPPTDTAISLSDQRRLRPVASERSCVRASRENRLVFRLALLALKSGSAGNEN